MPDGTPYLASTDIIGDITDTCGFASSGTATNALLGMAEALYKDDLEPDNLFEVISQCFLSALDRDCLSGWGAIVHIMYFIT